MHINRGDPSQPRARPVSARVSSRISAFLFPAHPQQVREQEGTRTVDVYAVCMMP